MPSFKRTHTQEKGCRILGIPVFGTIEKRTDEGEYLGSSETRTNDRNRVLPRIVGRFVAKRIAWLMFQMILGGVLILVGFSA